MSILWPSRIDPNPNGINRFGRFLHWTASLITACIGVGAIFGATYSEVDARGYWWWALVPMAIVYLLGRAARYVVSGE
jgi:hypothetical protein